MMEDGRSGYNSQPLEDEVPVTTGAGGSLEEKPPYVIFHETVQALGLYDQLDELRREHIQAYLTTPSSFRSLVEQGIATSRSEAGYLINTGLHTIFEHLPPELQEQYQSPQAILRLKTYSWEHAQQTRDRMSTTRKGKSISPHTTEHKNRIGESQKNSWKQRREQQAFEQGSPPEHIIFPDQPEQL